jgi:hypothetical protein
MAMGFLLSRGFGNAVRHAGLQLGRLLAPNVEHNNCCRQQQSSPQNADALEA